jgi:hypothetical protein
MNQKLIHILIKSNNKFYIYDLFQFFKYFVSITRKNVWLSFFVLKLKLLFSDCKVYITFALLRIPNKIVYGKFRLELQLHFTRQFFASKGLLSIPSTASLFCY